MKRFTKIEEDLLREKRESEEKFEQNYAEVISNLQLIKDNLETFKQRHDQKSDWGFVGSIVHVKNELEDILTFLGSSTPVQMINLDPNAEIQ